MRNHEDDDDHVTRVEPGYAGADRQDLPRSDIADDADAAERPETDVPLPFDEQPF